MLVRVGTNPTATADRLVVSLLMSVQWMARSRVNVRILANPALQQSMGPIPW